MLCSAWLYRHVHKLHHHFVTPMAVAASYVHPIEYACVTAASIFVGPLLFAKLIESGKVSHVFVGFAIGAVAMMLGGLAEILFGVKAEGQSLENLARPLTADDSPGSSAAPHAHAHSVA